MLIHLQKNVKKYLAEFAGTCILALVVGLSLTGSAPVATPVLAGLTLGLFVYTIGAISGAHINPGVTIGAWSIGKINRTDAIAYIVAQILGGGIAFAFVGQGIHLEVSGANHIWLAEVLGMTVFTFGIAAVMHEESLKKTSGIVIGGSLLLGITVAALLGSNGILNPAVAIGISSINLVYLIAPILGAIMGMWFYKYIASQS